VSHAAGIAHFDLCFPDNPLQFCGFASRHEVTLPSHSRNTGMVYSSRMTCRHFRYQVPRECADELRDADPEPCPVCDALPHRKALAAKVAVPLVADRVSPPQVEKPSWVTRLLGKRDEIIPALPTHARASA